MGLIESKAFRPVYILRLDLIVNTIWFSQWTLLLKANFYHSLDQAGEGLLETIRRTCNGRLTANEVLGPFEFVLTKLYRSA